MRNSGENSPYIPNRPLSYSQPASQPRFSDYCIVEHRHRSGSSYFALPSETPSDVLRVSANTSQTCHVEAARRERVVRSTIRICQPVGMESADILAAPARLPTIRDADPKLVHAELTRVIATRGRR